MIQALPQLNHLWLSPSSVPIDISFLLSHTKLPLAHASHNSSMTNPLLHTMPSQ
jgi:hypothetical protein